MRVLVVSQYFWPENFRINELVDELVRRGHELCVLTGKPNYPDGEIFEDFRADPARYARYAGAEIVRVPLVPRGKGKLRLALNYASFAVSGMIGGLFRLRGARFDAIFVFEPSPITVGLPAIAISRGKVPIVFWVLDLWPESLSATGTVRSRFILGAVERVVRFIYRRCALVLASSRSFIPQIARHLDDDDRRIRYFPNWSERSAAPAEVAPAPEVEAAPGVFTIMFTGNIGEAQDFPAILRAAEFLRDEPVRWIIVGDGRKAAWVHAEVARRGLEHRVFLPGRFGPERMPSFVAHADVLLLALRQDPAFAMTVPGKLPSYLASGVPVLAMLDGEGSDVVQAAGAGLTVPARDSAGLAQAVRQFMKLGPEARREMGHRGSEYCRREFDRKALVDRLEEWLKGVSRKSPG